MSRRRKNIIIILSLLAAAALVLIDNKVAINKSSVSVKSKAKQQHSDIEKYHGKTFTVVKVVDGDTIDINAVDGKYNTTRIRLWGVDAPETKHPKTGQMYFGKEASDFTKKLVQQKNVTVFLDENNNTRGKYSRLLAYIQLPDKRFLNEILLREGFAYADSRFQHKFYNKYQQLESTARSQKKGLWQNITPEQMPASRK